MQIDNRKKLSFGKSHGSILIGEKFFFKLAEKNRIDVQMFIGGKGTQKLCC